MNELNEQISTVKTPEEAVDQFVGEQFIEWLIDYIRHSVGSWPAIKFLASLEVKPEKIRKLLVQRYLALQALSGSEGDPGFLRFAIGNLSESNEPEAESPLEILEKKLEESSKPQSYIQSWKNILKLVGTTDEEISRTKPKEFTRTYIAELSDVYSTQEWQTALGAMASQEWSLAFEAPIWGSLIARSLDSSPKDVDSITMAGDSKNIIEAGHLLDKIIFDPVNKQLVWNGVNRQLELKKQFLDGLVSYLE